MSHLSFLVLGTRAGAQDIVLSSAGWVMVTCKEGETCRFMAFTPDGKGIWLREELTESEISSQILVHCTDF